MKKTYSDEELARGIAHMMEQSGPDKNAQESIWKNIPAHTQKHRSPVRAALVASIALAVMLTSTVGVNAATDGALFESVKKFIGLSEEQEEVAKETLTLPNEVYAPVLLSCSDKYLLFANERGLMVYDRTVEALTAALDLQELDCNYLNAESIQTCAYVEDRTLYLFNQTVSGRTATGKRIVTDDPLPRAYVYDLTLAGQEEALSVTEDKARLSGIWKGWKDYREACVFDTFDKMQGRPLDLNTFADKDDSRFYSRECICWTDNEGAEQLSFLVVTKDCEFILYSRPADGDALTTAALSIETAPAEADEENKLPEFQYSGDDAVLAALCRLTLEEESDKYAPDEDSVFIPAPHVLHSLQDGDDLVVFWTMQIYGYYRNGNTLCNNAGGINAAIARLTPDGAGSYTVTEYKTAGVGADYNADIRAWCSEYGLSEKLYQIEKTEREKIRLNLIRMYAENNNLDIKFYKDYGWDPVPLY